jgi:hypothetical protein
VIDEVALMDDKGRLFFGRQADGELRWEFSGLPETRIMFYVWFKDDGDEIHGVDPPLGVHVGDGVIVNIDLGLGRR